MYSFNFVVLQKNSQDVNLTDTNLCVVYAKPYSANTWSSNLGLQNLNQNEYLVVNNINETMHNNSTEIRIVKYDSSKREINNDNEIIIVRLTPNKVKLNKSTFVTLKF